MTDLTPHQNETLLDLAATVPAPDWFVKDSLNAIAARAEGMTDAEFDAYLDNVAHAIDDALDAREGDTP